MGSDGRGTILGGVDLDFRPSNPTPRPQKFAQKSKITPKNSQNAGRGLSPINLLLDLSRDWFSGQKRRNPMTTLIGRLAV